MTLLRYTRVSSRAHDAQPQIDALMAAGVKEEDIFSDVTCGSRAVVHRKGMKSLISTLRPGDTVVVWRLDRLGRSLVDILNTIETLLGRGVLLRSIKDDLDPRTESGQGKLKMLTDLSEYERVLVVERVNVGLQTARQAGSRFGRPPVDRAVVTEKLTLAREARSRGKTAAEAARLVGWSRATFYRYDQQIPSDGTFH